MRDTAPPLAVERSTTKPCPSGEYIAPRAKSAWPPLEDQYVPPTRLRGALAEQVDGQGGVDRHEAALLPMIRGSLT